MVTPRREVRDAGLLELCVGHRFHADAHREMETHNIIDRIDVFPLPEAPMSRTLHHASVSEVRLSSAALDEMHTFFFMVNGGLTPRQ